MKQKGKRKKHFLLGGILLLFLAGLVSQAFSYWPSVMASVQVMLGKEAPISQVQTDKKLAALSFDAAWGDKDTARILEILKKHNVKVTFFMTGGWIDSFPENVKMIAAEGHDLGNHSENHKEMSKLTEPEIRDELQSVHKKVKELTGVDMTLFRAPYGDWKEELITTAQDMGYQCIGWNVDSLDWKDYGSDSIVKTVCNHSNLGNGSIILLHNGATYTADALEAVITGLQAQGYELVPISQLLLAGKTGTNLSPKQDAQN
ncbi:polysaccharide deacetylase family protein [Hominifimenecus sp. rT4P-3]|uniref:polysaccharide deacetylase family protein n=1 Tax=Hominifimenecus sp. rT4P-3 TaxID=3242979 RepID=UPI003DA50A6B